MYLVSSEPCDTFLAGPEGARDIVAHGCPVFSLGEPYYAETMLPKGYKTIIDWFEEVAADPHYINPNFVRFDDDNDDMEDPQDPGIDVELKPISENFQDIE